MERLPINQQLSPEAYDARVDRKGARTALGKAVAEIAAAYLPPVSQRGNPQAFLDIAAGTGIISRQFAEQGYRVTAFDINQTYLTSLQDQKNPNIRIRKGDLNSQFPFRSGEFAGATIVWANRAITDVNQFISQVHRVLRPGGVFVWPVFQIENLFTFTEEGPSFPSADVLEGQLRNEGFSDVTIRKIRFFEARKRGIELFGNPRIIVAKK